MSYIYKVQWEVAPGRWQDIRANYNTAIDRVLRALPTPGPVPVYYATDRQAQAAARAISRTNLLDGRAARVVRAYVLPDQEIKP